MLRNILSPFIVLGYYIMISGAFWFVAGALVLGFVLGFGITFYIK